MMMQLPQRIQGHVTEAIQLILKEHHHLHRLPLHAMAREIHAMEPEKQALALALSHPRLRHQLALLPTPDSEDAPEDTTTEVPGEKLFVRVTLDGHLDSYEPAEEAILGDLASAMSVKPEAVAVVSVQAGSIVLTTAVVDGTVSAAEALMGAKLGGFDVTQVHSGSTLDQLEAAYAKAIKAEPVPDSKAEEHIDPSIVPAAKDIEETSAEPEKVELAEAPAVVVEAEEEPVAKVETAEAPAGVVETAETPPAADVSVKAKPEKDEAVKEDSPAGSKEKKPSEKKASKTPPTVQVAEKAVPTAGAAPKAAPAGQANGQSGDLPEGSGGRDITQDVVRAHARVQDLHVKRRQLETEVETLQEQVRRNAEAAAEEAYVSSPLGKEAHRLEITAAALDLEEEEVARQERIAESRGQLVAEAGQLQDEVSEILQSTQKQVRELEESVAGRRTLAQQLALEVAARDNEEAEMRAAKQKQMYKVAETSKEAYEEMRHSSTISSKLVKELQQVQSSLSRERERRIEMEERARDRDLYVGIRSEVDSLQEKMGSMGGPVRGTTRPRTKSAGRSRGQPEGARGSAGRGAAAQPATSREDLAVTGRSTSRRPASATAHARPSSSRQPVVTRPSTAKAPRKGELYVPEKAAKGPASVRHVPVDSAFNASRPSKAAQAVAAARQGTAILGRSQAAQRTAELAALTDLLSQSRPVAGGHDASHGAPRRSVRRVTAAPRAVWPGELDQAAHTVDECRTQIHGLAGSGTHIDTHATGQLEARLADVADLLKDCVDSQQSVSRRVHRKR